MECGKLTAKLRDAVPVCFIENGKEIKRCKNIEIPDALKVLPYEAFKFDVPATGAITFKITFAPGILPKPENWPQPRERKSRSPKEASVTTMAEEAAEPTEAAVEEAAQETSQVATEAPAEETPQEDATSEEPETMTIEYNATADYRRDLIKAIGAFLNQPLKYLNAPTFAYAIGEYIVDKHGTLTGPRNDELVEALKGQGYKA